MPDDSLSLQEKNETH